MLHPTHRDCEQARRPGDDRETDFFDIDRLDEPDFYVQNRGFAFHLAGRQANLGGVELI